MVNLKSFGLAIPILGIYPREIKTPIYTKIGTEIFMAALFVIARRWENSKHSLIDEQINKMQCVYAMGCYLAINRNGALILITTYTFPR